MNQISYNNMFWLPFYKINLYFKKNKKNIEKNIGSKMMLFVFSKTDLKNYFQKQKPIRTLNSNFAFVLENKTNKKHTKNMFNSQFFCFQKYKEYKKHLTITIFKKIPK